MKASKQTNKLSLLLFFLFCRNSKTKKGRQKSSYGRHKKKYSQDVRNSANIVESSDDNWNFGRTFKSEGDTPEDFEFGDQSLEMTQS